MQEGRSYIKDLGDFTNKVKDLQNIPEAVGFVPHKVRLGNIVGNINRYCIL